MSKKKSQPKGIVNRRARHDYELGDTLVVGVSLNGKEAKNLRRGNGQLSGSYVALKDNELWLINAAISGTNAIPIGEEEKTRSRKLLAKRREIDEFQRLRQQGLTIIPLQFLTGGRYIKLKIAAGRGKKTYDKRETIKKRDTERLNQKELKTYRYK